MWFCHCEVTSLMSINVLWESGDLQHALHVVQKALITPRFQGGGTCQGNLCINTGAKSVPTSFWNLSSLLFPALVSGFHVVLDWLVVVNCGLLDYICTEPAQTFMPICSPWTMWASSTISASVLSWPCEAQGSVMHEGELARLVLSWECFPSADGWTTRDLESEVVMLPVRSNRLETWKLFTSQFCIYLFFFTMHRWSMRLGHWENQVSFWECNFLQIRFLQWFYYTD